ncbi:RNA helicase [Podila minutissima]|uniref:RNA helicase n=1 Tax=Podila minutissima TaxID=64525 RepID=A0A9P5VJW1_9FUNG|nr:RNA helicase [Podila minutissima]
MPGLLTLTLPRGVSIAGRSLRQTGLVSRSNVTHIISPSTSTRIIIRPERILCRLRHTSAPSTGSYGKKWGQESSYGRSDRSARQFGGQEFVGLWETAALKNAVERFRIPNAMQQQLESLGTPRETAKELIAEFSERALRNKIPELSRKAIGAMATQSLEVGMTFKSMGVTREEAISSQLDRVVWDAFFTHCESKFPPDTLFRLSRLREIADLRYPAEWNPSARLMKRKIIMHVGPTNSGKTHNALLRLQAAESGAYLSPLRLLAHEVFERMNESGTSCNLVTGEERRYGVFNEEGKPEPRAAKVTSCTIEMVDLNKRIEVAVVDEIQMLADPDRGWAWAHALLSLPAQEIHLCGEPTVVNLVKNICRLTNEDVEVHEYDRLSKLEVQDQSLYGDLSKIQKGDCVVTFSRKNIFLLKKAIEAETNLRCAVAYGSLPPESRSTQAKLFNDPNSGYDVLVASDAIGMGLNLNIRRIIFEAVEKYDGSNVRALSLTQLKQIAGRAGRFGTDYAVGQATTLVQNDIPALKRALAAPMIEIQRAAIQPTAEMLEQFSHQMPGAPFSHVLKTFEMMSRNSDLFFPGLFRNMISTAEILDKVRLTIRERIPFISAPIQVRDPIVVEASLKMARAVSLSKPLAVDAVVQLPVEDSNKELNLDLRILESSHRVIMLYLWLSQRFSDVLEGGVESEATQRKVRCEKLIEMALKQEEARKIKKRQERAEKSEQRFLARVARLAEEAQGEAEREREREGEANTGEEGEMENQGRSPQSSSGSGRASRSRSHEPRHPRSPSRS